jgi:hypothetical protein
VRSVTDIRLRERRRASGIIATDRKGDTYVARLGSNLTLEDGVIEGAASPPPTSGATLNTFLSTGGQVVWESGFTFRVSAATYFINATRVSSAEQTITLDAADPSDPRLDVIALDTTGTVAKITGTPAAAASEPSVDPASYLKLAIVSVPAGSTSPAGATNVTLYAEAAGGPGEWNWTASAGSIVVNSTTNPHTGTTDIEGTNVGAGVYARGTIASGTIAPNDYEHLVFFLRSKAVWNNSRGLLVSFRSSGVLLGAAVQIRRTGTYGFDSAVTTAYQQVAIPLSAFAIPLGTTATQLQFEDFGGAIGFYMDNVTLQAGASTPAPSGITEAQADARYARLDSAFAVVGAADATLPNERRLTAGSHISLTDAGAGSTLTIAATLYGAITITLDGNGAVITTGAQGYFRVPRACTITKWTLLSADGAATAGSIVLDLWKDTYANYPPTVADTITAAAKPTLSAAAKNENSTLTGWTTAIAAGDTIGVNVDSVATLTRVVLQLEVTLG